MLEVNALGSIGKDLNFSFGVIITLFEVRKSSGCLTLKAEGGANFGPVNFEGCTSLSRIRSGQLFLEDQKESEGQLKITYSDSHL